MARLILVIVCTILGIINLVYVAFGRQEMQLIHITATVALALAVILFIRTSERR